MVTNKQKDKINKREIDKKLNNIKGLIVFIFIISNLFFLLMYEHIQSQISDLPKRVCHNETIEEAPQSNMTCIVDNSQGIHCDNLTFKSGEIYNYNCYDDLTMHYRCFDNSELVNPPINKIKIKSTKEVCEIK